MEFVGYSRDLAVRGLIIAVFLGLWSQQISAQISVVPIPETPAERAKVLLSVSGVTGNIRNFNWYRGESAERNQMLSYIPTASPPDEIFDPYKGRVRGFPNGSMEISGVTKNDSGTYTVQIQANGQQVARVNVTVYEKLSKPNITANFTHPVEHRDSVTLTCVTSSADQTILWSKDSQRLPSDDRMSLSQDNRTLTISNVSISDAGNYQCEVINPVSRNMSDPYTLSVYHGPKNVKIIPKGPITQPLKSQLTLDCVTESVPAPNYTWTLNDIIKGQWGKLILTDITFHDQGNFTCEVYNPVTQLSGSASVYINVTGTAASNADGGGLSGGAIAGIVIGILVAVALIAALVYLFLLKGNKSNSNEVDMKETKPNSRSDHNRQSSDRYPVTTGEEVNYSEVNFKPGASKPTQPRPQEKPTEYAEIRRS